ncbi:MAG: hypothetical protein AB8G96_05325 [Phycisphaerales bacterium]
MNDLSYAQCPRCGHHIGGIISSWAESCPLAGRCSECGLDFRWGEAISGALQYPWWTTERRGGWFATLVRSLVQPLVAGPGVVWFARSLRLEHRIRWARLVAGAMLVFLAVWLGGAALVTIGLVSQGLPHATAAAKGLWPGNWTSEGVFTIKRPQRGFIEVATVTAGPRSGVAPRSFTLQLDQVWEADLPVQSDPIPEFRRSDFQSGRRLDGKSFIYVADDGRRVYVTKIPVGIEARSVVQNIEQALIEQAWFFQALQGTAYSSAVPIPPGPLLPVALAPILAAGVFAVLPIARRRARVRWQHIGRLATYAGIGSFGLTVIVFIPFSIWIRDLEHVGQILGAQRRGGRASLGAGVLFLLLPAIWASLWWWAAARWYLRMTRPLAVGLAVGLIAAIALGFATMLLFVDLLV